MSNALAEAYREAQQAQRDRFDNRPGAGGVDHSMTDTEEYRRYFGLGAFAGSGEEELITWAAFRAAWKAEKTAERRGAGLPDEPQKAAGASAGLTAADAFFLYKPRLKELAEAGDIVARVELARRKKARADKRAAKAQEGVAA